MSVQDDAAPMMRDLERLQRFSPDPARSARVRARCRAQLERTRPSERAARSPDADERLVTPVLVGCLCGVYVVTLVGLALRMYSLLE